MSYIGFQISAAAKAILSHSGLNPKSSPIAWQTPSNVSSRRNRLGLEACIFRSLLGVAGQLPLVCPMLCRSRANEAEMWDFNGLDQACHRDAASPGGRLANWLEIRPPRMASRARPGTLHPLQKFGLRGGCSMI